MAWRPHEYLVDGVLDNTEAGKVTGWLRFVGLPGPVLLQLQGDCHRDVRGAVLALQPAARTHNAEKAYKQMQGFAAVQVGVVGDITAGRMPFDYVVHPYVEWYSRQNGRVVLELPPEEVEVVGTPWPWEEQTPLSRRKLDKQYLEYVRTLRKHLRVSADVLSRGH